MKCIIKYCLIALFSSINFMHAQYIPVKEIQNRNIDILTETLPQGWKAFCTSPVNEGVMSMYHDINPSEASIRVMTSTNQSISLPIRLLSELPDYDIDVKRKTLIYINAYYAPDSYFSVQAHLKLLQERRRDLNIIIVDFAKHVQQLYYAVRHHVALQGFFVANVLTALVEHGIKPEDITLAGHSVGANIAALGATLYAGRTKSVYTPTGVKMGQLVAIDPALMCTASDIHVNRNVSSRVVVIHGEGDVFGIREPRGTIDIYPNGIGYFPRRRLQPGCDTNLCSHMYPFVLFMEALIEGVMVPAVKCDSWAQFRQRSCDYENIVVMGLKYPDTAEGLYFCMTQANPPFTFMEHGLRYKKKSLKQNNSIKSDSN